MRKGRERENWPGRGGDGQLDRMKLRGYPYLRFCFHTGGETTEPLSVQFMAHPGSLVQPTVPFRKTCDHGARSPESVSGCIWVSSSDDVK